IVEVGDPVKEGQVIGKSSGAASANIHSPIPGVVRAILRVPDLFGGQTEALSIALEGSFERLGRKMEIFPWKGLTRNQVLKIIAEKGIVEDDGSGIPLYDRIHDPKGLREPLVLVVNCLESDPWNFSIAAVIEERWEAILEGIEILRKVLTLSRVILAMDDDASPIADAVGRESLQAESPTPDVVRLAPRYPQDLSGLLREAVLGRKPSAPKALVVSALTVASVYDAVVLNKPQIERYVTVTGDAVKHPDILRARIGTSIGELLEECGGFVSPPESILLNGPFRGSAVADLDFPVLKSTRSVVALTIAETRRKPETACIRCGRCILGCPARLDPYRLYKSLVCGDEGRAFQEGLGACIACGSCAFLCPSRLPLVQVFSLATRSLVRKGPPGEGRPA
ncbi:MAG TPA: RnfABCDGE type electron transport complex subunit C, partial [Magnetospirillaceae bacterium]|nr:RnfABCDGE type electron transport complex subunit C [Magnetospirillaceae bacterium]